MPAPTAPNLKHGEPIPPLPRLAFPLAGAWLAYEFLGPTSATMEWALGQLGGWLAMDTAFLNPIFVVGACLLGAVAGWIVSKPLNRLLGIFFRAFNGAFAVATNGYVRAVSGLLRVSVIVLVVYAGLLVLTYMGFAYVPKGFIPAQDMGYLLVNVQLPDSASTQRTDAVMRHIEQIAKHCPGVKNTVAVAGQSLLLNANAPNFGAMFVMLDDFDKRRGPELSGEAISARLQTSLQDAVEDAAVHVFVRRRSKGSARRAASR